MSIPRSIPRGSLCALWLCLLSGLYACSEDTQETNDPAPETPNNETPGNNDGPAPMCDLPERLVILDRENSADPCLGRIPGIGESMILSNGRIKIGELDLAVGQPEQDCTLPIESCTVDLAQGNRASVSGVLDVSRKTLRLEAQQAEAFRLAACEPVEFSLAETPQNCHLGGRFRVETEPQLVEGTCDLTWAAEVVSVSVTDPSTAEGTLVWGDDSYNIVAIDENACTVTAQTEFSIFNGVARTTSITATLEGPNATLTIQDALEGTSDFDETCVGARFEGQATAIEPGGTPWEAQCEPLPFVCGNGTCEESQGENCEVCPEDCGCAQGNCVRYRPPQAEPESEPIYACAENCSGACESNQRCVPANEFDTFFTEGDPATRICLDANDEVPRGGPCTDSRDCADGLLCSEGQCLADCSRVDPSTCKECRFFAMPSIEVCIPPCAPNRTDQCGAGACLSRTVNHACTTLDRELWFCHPAQFFYECRPQEPPSFGTNCAQGEYCGIGAGCLEEGCTRVEDGIDCTNATMRCSRPCDSDADCEDPLPFCSTVEIPGQAPTHWCISAP